MSQSRAVGLQSGEQMLILKYYKYTQMKLTKKILDKARVFRNQIVRELFSDEDYMLKKKSKFRDKYEVDNLESDESNFSELEDEIDNKHANAN